MSATYMTRQQRAVLENIACCPEGCATAAELAEQLVSQHIENAKHTMIERFSQNG